MLSALKVELKWSKSSEGAIRQIMEEEDYLKITSEAELRNSERM